MPLEEVKNIPSHQAILPPKRNMDDDDEESGRNIFSLWTTNYSNLRGGFGFFYVLPYLEKWSNLANIFQVGWFNHQLLTNGATRVHIWRRVFFRETTFNALICAIGSINCHYSPLNEGGIIINPIP